MTSQITKDFRMKSKLRRLADGGSSEIPTSAPNRGRPPEPVIGTRSPLRSGGGGGLSREAVAAAMNPPAPPPPAPYGVGALPADPLRNPRAIQAARERAAGLADGGSYLDAGYNANRYQQSQLRDGGRVNGPGGRTDDKVGPVMLSDEEYVLPGDTADAIGRDKLDAIRLATHEFKDARKESALRGRADGGDGWYDDMMPMDHLADGGNPWIVDSKGTVRPNAFGDAAAGPGYQQPRLPPPQPGTAAGPSAISPGIGGRRVVDMGMVEQVPKSPAPQMGPVSNPNVGPNGSAEARAFRSAAGNAFGDAAAAAKDPSLVSRAGSALRTTGSLLAKGAGVVGGGMAAKDMYDNGVNAGNTGDLAASAATFAGPVGMAGATGWGVGRAIGNNLSEGTRDVIGGTINQGVRNVGKLIGQDWGVDDTALLQLKAEERMRAGAPSAAQPSPVVAATSALRSDRGPALPVAPDSYQSRRLSEMGVPLDVQNSKPVIDSVNSNTHDFLRTGGTSQFQNLGTYGGNGNIYGKADDPSRPGRINSFVGVGAGASPQNEYNGSGADGAITSALRSLGKGPSSSGDSGNSGPADNSAAINARFDKLAKDLSGMYGPKGQGNLARRLLELEQARSTALDADARNITSRNNASLQSSTLRDNAELNARVQMANALGDLERTRATSASQAQAAQLKALQDAQKYSDERQDKGAARTDKMIEAAFTSNVDGKDVVDRQSIAQLNEFLGSGQAVHNGKPFMALNEQERAAALPNIINAFRVNKSMNEGGGFIGGGRTANSPSPLRVREAEVGDLVNGLGVWEYLGSKLMPGYDANVVERTADRKVRSVEQVAGDDLERRKAILRNLATGN